MTIAVCTLVATLSPCAAAQVPGAPSDDELLKGALHYLGMNAYQHALRQSDCNTGTASAPPAYEVVVAKEVLPLLPENARERSKAQFTQMKAMLLTTGANFIRTMHDETLKAGHTSKEFRCGYITGVITTEVHRTQKAWQELAARAALRKR